MLGRGVGDLVRRRGVAPLFSPGLVETLRDADALVLNLECAVSERGARWPEPGKPFFFRAPPRAVEALALLGVDCVTLANNHALDYGAEALLDTVSTLRDAGIATVGAGVDQRSAREPVVLDRAGLRLGVVGMTDHPRSYAAQDHRPGVAYAEDGRVIPDWVARAIAGMDADAVLVTPHWGPNMTSSPSSSIRKAAAGLHRAGATLVAGHSAHVFHGVEDSTLYDMGDLIDDYAVDARLRNDLGLVFFVTLQPARAARVEAVPIRLEYCHTSLARGDDAAWIARRFIRACADMGTGAHREGDRLVVES